MVKYELRYAYLRCPNPHPLQEADSSTGLFFPRTTIPVSLAWLFELISVLGEL